MAKKVCSLDNKPTITVVLGKSNPKFDGEASTAENGRAKPTTTRVMEYFVYSQLVRSRIAIAGSG